MSVEKKISLIIEILLSFPIAKVDVAHSPTPSSVRITASLKGDG